jgi:hypothetical protein
VFNGGSNTDVSFQFRSPQANSVVLFAFGGTGTYYLVQFVNSSLQWTVSANGFVNSLSFSIASVTLCDNRWHTVRLMTVRLQMLVTIDGIPIASNDPQISTSIVLVSYFYVGGIPFDDDQALQFISDNAVKINLKSS